MNNEMINIVYKKANNPRRSYSGEAVYCFRFRNHYFISMSGRIYNIHDLIDIDRIKYNHSLKDVEWLDLINLLEFPDNEYTNHSLLMADLLSEYVKDVILYQQTRTGCYSSEVYYTVRHDMDGHLKHMHQWNGQVFVIQYMNMITSWLKDYGSMNGGICNEHPLFKLLDTNNNHLAQFYNGNEVNVDGDCLNVSHLRVVFDNGSRWIYDEYNHDKLITKFLRYCLRMF